MLYCGSMRNFTLLCALLFASSCKDDGNVPAAVVDGGVDAGAVDLGADANVQPDSGPMCSESCATDELCCGAAVGCIATLVDVNNCGACGNTCLAGKGESCNTGQCVCGDILEGCNGTSHSMCCPAHGAITTAYCANFDQSATDCGGCGIACDATQSDRCSGGHCYCGTAARGCAGTATDYCCISDIDDNGACVNTTTDNTNCGGCNIRCNGLRGEHCVDGTCVSA